MDGGLAKVLMDEVGREVEVQMLMDEGLAGVLTGEGLAGVLMGE